MLYSRLVNKSQIIDSITSRVASLDKMIVRLKDSSIRKQRGHLIYTTIRGSVRYYLVKGTDSSKSREYLTDKKTLVLMATKHYQDAILQAAVREKRQLEMCLTHLQKSRTNSDVENVLETIAEPIRVFVKPEVETDEGYARRWQSKWNKLIPKDSNHPFKTMKGDYVRSKSEALIADRLFALGIPYAYEQAGFYDEINGHVIHPDFYVLNKRTLKEYVWEHCGIMDNSTYCNITLHRLKIFSEKGYIQGKNLLFSYETSQIPLNIEYIELLINEYLK